MELRVIKGREAVDTGLGERIIAFDRRNMGPVLDGAGVEFPEEKRRRGLESGPTLIVALDGPEIAGYVEYGRSWDDARYLYVGSLQIGEKYRRTGLILRLLEEFRSRVSAEDFVGFETSVQKTNAAAVRMYRKIGFRLEENPRNEASWLARAGREILKTSPVIKLIDRWRAKRRGR